MNDETRLSIDAVVEQYVSARKDRELLTIAELLQRRGAHDRGCLEALVLADAKIRFAEDGQVSADEYLRQWPELTGSDCLVQVRQLASREVASQDDGRSSSSGPASDPKGIGDYVQGEQISHFEIIRLIGKGTHGCVYLAMDLTLRRIVALKISAASGVEGEALARLDHPNVVRVFGEQSVGGHKLLAMQFVPGQTLAKFLSERPFQRPGDWDSLKVRRWIGDQIPSGDVNAAAEDVGDEQAIRADRYEAFVVHLIVQVARALKHAHQRGVLHRDVKPSNVILDRRAKPMLMDFNVARLETEFDASEFGGTLPYMSPEHLRAYQDARHSTDDVDVRSDLYSLGIMLLELLSGHTTWGELPADGQRLVPALLAQRLGGIPEAFLHGIRPKSLRGVLSKCLATYPDKRYQSAGDLAADLQAWLDGRPLVYAEGNSVPRQVLGIARRHPKSCVLASIVMVACIGGLYSARSMSQARIESGWEKIERARFALLRGDTTTASTLIGETRGMIGDFSLVGRLDKSSGREIASQLRQLENEVRKMQFNSRADVVRLTFASSPRRETMDVSMRLLESYGVVESEDWESLPPFANLDDSSQQIIGEGIAEMMLMVLLQMQDSGARADAARLAGRLPLRYRSLPVFGATFGEGQAVEQATKMHGDSFEAHLQGMVAFHAKRFDDAHVWFDRSGSWREETIRPRFWTSFWHARACEELDRIGQAIALYGTCIGQRPGFSWPRYNLARLLAEDGQLDSAMHYIEAAIQVDEEFAPAHVLKSAILVEQGHYRHALAACQDAAGLADASVDLYKNRAAAHAGLNDFERAYEDLVEARRLAPDDQKVESDLARIKELLEPAGRR